MKKRCFMKYKYDQPTVNQVLWGNIRSRRSYYLGGVFFNLILIFLVVICSTPGRPICQIEEN